MLSEPNYLYYVRLPDFEERRVLPYIPPSTGPLRRYCQHGCGAEVDVVETANQMLPWMTADKGTNSPHWKACPKQSWRWKLKDPEPMGGKR